MRYLPTSSIVEERSLGMMGEEKVLLQTALLFFSSIDYCRFRSTVLKLLVDSHMCIKDKMDNINLTRISTSILLGGRL